jgi:L-threonylcarbamoyladenylate synthase
VTGERPVPADETAPGHAVALDADGAAAFERCIAADGAAVFPADTVYGIAVDPESAAAVERLNALKQRDPTQPSAVMFFALDAALTALPELGSRTRAALERLLPGPVTAIVPNPEGRFPLACGAAPERLGVRVPALAGTLAALAVVRQPVLQSSANLHGAADPRRLADVPRELLDGVDLALDGGELPGTPSTVVDLTSYEDGGGYEILREGAVPASALARLL